LGDSVDPCSYVISQAFIFPICKEGELDNYKVYRNLKGKKLFSTKNILAAKLTVKKKNKVKRSKNRAAKHGRPFVPVKFTLNSYDLKTDVLKMIKTGDASEFNHDRSAMGFFVIENLINLGLPNDVIASILLKPKYKISSRFIYKGAEWTLVEIDRISEKLMRSRKRIFNDVEPYYSLPKEVSVSKAFENMRKRIDKWVCHPVGYFGLKLPAGIGKTEEYIKAISNSNAKLIEVYVPTHNLANECYERLIDKGVKLGTVTVIQGRSYRPEDGVPLCHKDTFAKKLGELGISTYKSLCRNDAGKQCEYFEGCAYLAQYSSSTQIRIYTHAHIALERGLLDKECPDFAIIDESFYSTLLDEKTTTMESLVYYIKNRKLAKTINRSFKKNKPLLKCLRKKFDGETEKVINNAIGSISRDYPGIKPNNTEEQIASRLTIGFKKSQIIKILLQQILAELTSFPERDRPISIRRNENNITISQRKKITRFIKNEGNGDANHVPVLCVDADFCRDIVKIFLPGIKSKTIFVKRNAIVTQAYSNSGAKSRYIQYAGNFDLKIKANCKTQLDDVQQVINNLHKQHNNLLVVTYKPLLIHKSDQPLLTMPNGCKSIHFGGLRGIDKFNDCDAVLVCGRNQPPVQAVESIAACLWWDSDNELKLTGKCLQEVRGYRLVSGDKKGVNVWNYKDNRLQIVLEQIRECESLQAIDRLRLMHNAVPKHVFLLSNLPLNIDVDHLVKWKDIVSGGSHVEQILADKPNVVLPLSPKFLAQEYSEYFSISVAKKEAASIGKDAERLNDDGYYFNSPLLGKRFKLWSYRIVGTSGRDLTAIASNEVNYDDVQNELRAIHSEDINLKLRT